MPVTYRIDQNIVQLTFEGENEPDAVIATFDRALLDPTSPPRFALLVDVRKSTSLASRATEDIIRVASHLGPHKDRVSRCAVLATEDVHFGLGRMGAVYSEAGGVMTNVFRDRDEALAWLRSAPKP
jgi:hypothetical protein